MSLRAALALCLLALAAAAPARARDLAAAAEPLSDVSQSCANNVIPKGVYQIKARSTYDCGRTVDDVTRPGAPPRRPAPPPARLSPFSRPALARLSPGALYFFLSSLFIFFSHPNPTPTPPPQAARITWSSTVRRPLRPSTRPPPARHFISFFFSF